MESAIVTIQLGQCGNQVGAACFEGLAQQLLQTQPFKSNSTTTTNHTPIPTLTRPSQRTTFQQTIARRFFREIDINNKNAQANSSTHNVAGESSSSTAESVPLPRARAILIDMEPKVIQQALSVADASHLFRYTPSNSFYRQSGSGNNWSYGFGVHGPQCREEMMERVRKEVERAESLGGFIIHQSLAGGTGSGVGAFLTECMHDEYPGEQLINQVVWPYANGEVIVQNYNALLTLAHLNEYSHGILLFENDSLHQICSRRLHVRTPTFQQLNRIIAENLTNVLLPGHITQAQPFYQPQVNQDDPMTNLTHSNDKRQKTKFIPPNDAGLLANCPRLQLWSDPLAHLFSHPSYKLSTIRTIPQLNVASKSFQCSSWSYLLKYLYQMQLTGHVMEDGLDFSLGSFSKQADRGGYFVNKRKWHKHWSATANTIKLYDNQTNLIESLTTVPTTTNISAASPTASISGHPTSTAAAQFDAPLPPPSYLPAFIDGESYLECRLQLESEESQSHGSYLSPKSSRMSHPPTSPTTVASPSPYNSTLSSLLYLRGSGVGSADATNFLDPSLYASFSLNPLMVVRDTHSLHGDERLSTLWSNSSSVAEPLDRMLESVYGMLHARAYVHHYEKYGIDQEWFWSQVAAMEQISTDYKGLSYQSTTDE